MLRSAQCPLQDNRWGPRYCGRHPAATGCRDELQTSPPPSGEEPAVKRTRGTQAVPDRTYYQHAGVQVSERWFITPGGRYRVSEMHRLRAGRGPLPLAVRAALGIALPLMFAVAVGFPFYHRDR